MKKLILIFVSLVFISCSQIKPYLDGEVKNKLMIKGYNELMTAQEKEKLENNGKVQSIMFKGSLRNVLTKPLDLIRRPSLSKSEVEEAVHFITKFQNKIIVFDNSPNIEIVILYMGKSESGRNTLKNCRFLFLNYISRESVERLSKRYGFKYSYPKIEDIK